jgi:hypothetical protein
MPRATARLARKATVVKESTNVAVVRGRLVALPTVRVVDRHQRATTFDLACLVNGKRTVVPVVALNLDLPIIKVGDEVTALGHVRRRFFRVGARTQSITELVVERIVAGPKTKQLDALYGLLDQRACETRETELPRPTSG